MSTSKQPSFNQPIEYYYLKDKLDKNNKYIQTLEATKKEDNERLTQYVDEKNKNIEEKKKKMAELEKRLAELNSKNKK